VLRIFEIILILTNVVLLAMCFVAQPHLTSLRRYFALIVCAVAASQILIEGYRWQMFPAYSVAISLGIYAFINLRYSVWMLIPLAAITVISIALPIAFPIPTLPQPTGKYRIGTVTYEWMDTARTEKFTDDPNDHRELMVQIWYPTNSNSTLRAPYVSDSRTLVPLSKLLKLPSFTLDHLKYAHTNAIPSAPAADDKHDFPILIFSHGRGGYRQHNTWQIEELVSQGYIVVAIDHTYAASGVAFSDGRIVPIDARMLDRPFINSIIPYLAQDASFVLDQLTMVNRLDPKNILTGKLDLQNIGMFGLSLGGETTAEACHADQRIKACLIMDVWMFGDVLNDGLQQPTMFITRDAATMQKEGWKQADIDETLKTMRAVYEMRATDGYFVQIKGMFHQDFSDAPLLSPLTSVIGLTGSIDSRRGHEIVSAYSLAFFDRYLRSQSAPLLDSPPSSPEVIFEMRR
jgi:predicted dienelactone hydrolase